ISRFLLAIPGLILLAEIYRYAKHPGDRELPVNVISLIYYYVAFSFPCFFDMPFYDINGPVAFTEHAYAAGAIAVALGVSFLYAGMRAGELVGVRARPAIENVSPPAEVPSSFARATFWYALLCVLLSLSVVSAFALIPGEIGVLVNIVISFELAIGLTLAKAEYFQGRWTKYTGVALLVLGGMGGMIRGVLDPAIRLGIATVTGRWANTGRFALRLVAGVFTVYLLFQPIKHDFRSAVWRARDTSSISYTDRLDAWVNAFTSFWVRDSSSQTQDEAKESAIGRLSELDPVLHAIDVVPIRVQPLEGTGWLPILTSPIPRIIWRDKPTTSALLEQRYAIVFKRQTEAGARGTAILLPLLVDGYWNLQWFGIPIACFMMGLWIGACQKIFSGPHWALRAMGVAHLARLVAQGPVAGVYSGLFQHVTGLILACWLVYGIAKLLSRTTAAPTSFVAASAAARRRRALTRPTTPHTTH
ncbi:MAG: hypothetical protein ABI193_11215, partial [Minicystis sp.]